ncbi:MAG: nucleoside deaminase [Alphaproteobacteria bacterium]|nr:nucleoside deaminase [Alphaproteobacteria bacterium]
MDHTPFLDDAYAQAKKSYDEGGLPIGAVLVASTGQVLGRGHNQRVQRGSPILHGEMDCLQNAGRRASYRDAVLYTTLSPCMMCSGTIVQFGIPRVVIADVENFEGDVPFLESRGVTVEIVPHAPSIALMRRFIAEKPDLWAEDIADT